MYRAPRYSYIVHGDHNAICERCQFQYKFSELRLDGESRGTLWVCERCYDELHPQNFVQAKPEDQRPPFVQAEPADKFEGEPVSKEGESATTIESVDGSAYHESVAAGTHAEQATAYSEHPESTGTGVLLVAKHSE